MGRSRPLRPLLCLCALLLAATAASVQSTRADDAEKIVDPVILEQAWQGAKTMFYDPTYRGVDWDSVLDRYRARAKDAVTQRELHGVVTDMLGELKASHTELITPKYMQRFLIDGPKRIGVPQFGMTLTRLKEGFFVSRILPGSSSDAGGVRRGDRLVSINGRPPNPAQLLGVPYESGLGGPRSYLIPCEKTTQVKVEFERTPTPLGRYRVKLQAHGWNETAAGLYSQRVIKRDGLRLGYVRIYHLLGYDPVFMTHEFIRTHPRLDGMIVDLRGRGGAPEAAAKLISYFDRSRVAPPAPPGSSPNQTRRARRAPSGAYFSKPCVALMDHGTRSVKELIAFEWRRRRIGALVGQRTRGAFLGVEFPGGLRRLSDNSFLMVPSIDMRPVAGGVDIEGEGIEPDVYVEDELRYANGRDPILDAGANTLRLAILASKRRKGAWH
ncbi:MAG: PDZ domain-containing protein [Planctomycetes bacterium]|nr:PDZ domain-containing protein [Planctomycetota bacterium]